MTAEHRYVEAGNKTEAEVRVRFDDIGRDLFRSAMPMCSDHPDWREYQLLKNILYPPTKEK